MLDESLARLYGVSTSALVQAVKRNPARFPPDFMFRLNPSEMADLKSQIVISNRGRGGRRYMPYVFTAQGVAMLSSILRSQRAVVANIAIMRAFVRLRSVLVNHAGLARRLNEIERTYDARFKLVFDAIRKLMTTPESSPRRMGFDPTRQTSDSITSGGILRRRVSFPLAGRGPCSGRGG